MHEQRNRAGKGPVVGLSPAAAPTPTTLAPNTTTTSGGGSRWGVLRREIALLSAFSLVSIAMAVYLSTMVPRTGEARWGESSGGGTDDVGIVIVTQREDGSKLAVPMPIDKTVGELRSEVRAPAASTTNTKLRHRQKSKVTTKK